MKSPKKSAKRGCGKSVRYHIGEKMVEQACGVPSVRMGIRITTTCEECTQRAAGAR